MSQRAYVVIGAKGGVGATTLALELVDRVPGATRVLVDGDLAGHRAHAVALDCAAALDQGREPGAPAATALRGKSVVELTRTFEDGFALTAAAVEPIRNAFSNDAVFVVDAPQPFANALRPFILRAAAFLVVTEPTLLGLAATRATCLALKRAGIARERTHLIVIAAHGVRDVRRTEIETVTGMPVMCELPSLRDRAFGKALDTLARELAQMPPADVSTTLAPVIPLPFGDRRAAARPNASTPLRPVASAPDGAPQQSDEIEALKAEIHQGIMSQVDFLTAARAHTDEAKLADLRAQVGEIVERLIAGRDDIGSADLRARLRREIVEEAVGLGAIEGLLRDDEITEVMVNGYDHVYVERHGRIEKTAKRFADNRQVRLVIDRIIAPLGRRIDESSPMVDARLSDGSRVNAIIEPLAIDGPMLTIRRFGTRRLRMTDLVTLDSLTQPFADFLDACVEARLNIVVSGGTGSGKTTLLNAVSTYIPRTERIITIEDAAELLLDQPHVVRLESRPANLEGTGAVTIRDLVRNSLRMRPDRIIVGECRGGEALDMLQAMNTGHDGSLTTVHANSPRDAMSRIETMVLMAGFDLPVRAIREQISSAINMVVQVERLRDGSRKIVSITEVVGMEGDIVTMQEIARFRQRGVDAKGMVIGEFETSGVQPNCLVKFDEMGIEFDVASLGRSAPEERAWALR